MAHPFDPVFPINREWSFKFAEEYIKTGISDKLPISIFSRADSFYVQSPKKNEFDEEGKEKISTEWETVNKAKALWVRAKSEISDEEYKEFYKECSNNSVGTTLFLSSYTLFTRFDKILNF